MTESTVSSPAAAQRGTRRKWFLALGALLVVLGVAGIGMANILELTSVVVFGPVLLASAVIQVLIGLFEEQRKDSLFHFAASAVEAGLGFWIMMHPLEQLMDVVVLLAIFFLVSGVIRGLQSLATQSPGRGWNLLTAVVAVGLGACVWLRWPDSRWWFLGLCIALDLLCRGILWTALAFAQSKSERAATV
ncbi:MAG: DUF308 domain-containing protein [Gemmataceae bacterium]|nr:DUF308 domain-containing protein [Gemmataceae bacterium]